MSTGWDSPVSAASSTRRFLTCSKRRSAGTLSPESSRTRSPGTRSSAGTSQRSPPLSTRARRLSMWRIAWIAFSALPSCTNPMLGVDHDHTDDHRSVHDLPEHGRNGGRAEQHVDQQVVELKKKPDERPAARGGIATD